MKVAAWIAKSILCLSLLASGSAAAALTAAPVSKSQYISAWTSACISGGQSSKLKLSDAERNNIFLVKPMAEGYSAASRAMGMTVSASAEIRKTCSCMARYIAARKSNLMAPTARSLADAAFNACI